MQIFERCKISKDNFMATRKFTGATTLKLCTYYEKHIHYLY